MILFLADVGVKENRRTLLCKRSGGERGRRRTEIRCGRGARATDQRKKDLTQRSRRRRGHGGRKTPVSFDCAQDKFRPATTGRGRRGRRGRRCCRPFWGGGRRVWGGWRQGRERGAGRWVCR